MPKNESQTSIQLKSNLQEIKDSLVEDPKLWDNPEKLLNIKFKMVQKRLLAPVDLLLNGKLKLSF